MKRYGFLLGCIILVCGLMWSSLALAVTCPPRKACKESIVLAKRADKNVPECFVLYDCLPAKNCDDCIMRMQWKLIINSKDPLLCDETENLIPNGSILAVDATWHMRRNGPCTGPLGPVPVGTHEGKFKIITPAGVTIATGKMKGTNGLETHGGLTGECCKDRHDEGCLEGIINTPSGACKLRATYSSTHDSPISEVCSETYWHFWGLLIDGIILCPCP